MAERQASANPPGEQHLGSWQCCARPAGSVACPDALAASRPDWVPAPVPGTVALALRAAGRWDLGQPLDADAHDWWYRTTFPAPAPQGSRCVLRLDGLATLAEVWLNGQRLLTTDNMFRAYRVDLAPHLREENELAIVFRSLNRALEQKRPRPRWKTNLVRHQQLRWFRTTLLGRMPGWTPPVPPVGPWRPVRLDTAAAAVNDLHLVATLASGGEGIVRLRATVESAGHIEGSTLAVGDAVFPLKSESVPGGYLLEADVRVADPPLWWPHTHGEPAPVDWSLAVTAGGDRLTLQSGKLGFRHLEVDQAGGRFGLRVNGVPVYCRGACWTVGDPVSLDGGETGLAHDLRLARDAGANLLRVNGTMFYESDRFYDLCSELGLLVWQDFAFASMDYPIGDGDLAANVRAEAVGQLTRLARQPCVVVYCGNSEVEQQAAMLGVPAGRWRNAWFGEKLPALRAELHPGTAYVPSSPSGGVLPFHVGTGVCHYFGVGGYRRPLADVRRAAVPFASECLAFAALPEPATLEVLGQGERPGPHLARWKERAPRDVGASWDHEDVRDHYLRELFGVDPARLRSFDLERYLQLSRVVPGEMMSQVFAEWRGTGHNRGGLIWFYKDFWPGPGLGLLDSRGLPKAAYYYLRRSWQPRQLALTDEGLDGLALHVLNETAESLAGSVELALIREPNTVIARGETAFDLPPWSRQTFSADALLGGFHDVTHAYRFGPPGHQAAVATLWGEDRQVLSEVFYFPERREPVPLQQVDLQIEADRVEGEYHLRLRADALLRAVSFDVRDFLPDDNYFHLAPGREKVVRFRPLEREGGPFKGYVEALNLRNPIKIVSNTPSA